MNTLESFARSPLAEGLGWSLLHFLWQGALIAAAAWLALRFARAARLRYAIACVALLAMPLIFGITLWLSIPQAPGKMFLPIGVEFPRATPDPRPANHAAPHDPAAYVKWAAPLWLAGVACVLLYRLGAWIFAMRLRRRGTCGAPAEWIERVRTLATRIGVSRPVVLLESALAEVPVMMGYLRPAILMPLGMLSGLPAEQVEAILLHELAHIRRADYLVSLAQTAIESLLFYHPAVWWISGVIRAERENCCDDAVLAAQADPHVYATALAAMEHNRWRAPEPALAANDGDLLRRIRRVLRGRTPEARDSSVPLIPAAALLVMAAIAFAAQARPIDPAQAPAEADRYEKWLKEDVVYIITTQEKQAFEALTSDQEREKFIEQFWLRRDPTPGTPENEFRDEHYRRIAFVNTRFKTATIAGWKTDRGRIYIVYGPPDEIESHPSGGTLELPDGTTVATAPFEQWVYRTMPGIGMRAIMEFEGNGMSMTLDPGPAGHAPIPPAQHISAKANSPGMVTIAVPLDARVPTYLIGGNVTNAAGFLGVAWFNETVQQPFGAAFVKEVKLPPGSYVVNVSVRGFAGGGAVKAETYSESVAFEVH